MTLKRKLAQFARGQITHVWEVVLPPNIANKIYHVAKAQKVTMSWIVRFCVFKTIQQDCSNIADEMVDLVDEIKQNLKNAESKKRFFLCLYGDDELHLRIVARKANLTVSMLIRLAIYLYLDFIVKESPSYDELFWFGIKFTKEIKLSPQHLVTVQDFLNKVLFQVSDFWGIPPSAPYRKTYQP